MYVCMYVCLLRSSGNPYLKICDLMQYFFADAPMKKKKEFVYEGVQYFLDTKYKIFFFVLVKKSSSQP